MAKKLGYFSRKQRKVLIWLVESFMRVKQTGVQETISLSGMCEQFDMHEDDVLETIAFYNQTNEQAKAA